MKKLLVLMLVLGMASMANAAYILNWNGTTLSIGSDAAGYEADVYFAVICDTSKATIGAGTVLTTNYDATMEQGAASDVVANLPAGMDGRWGNVGSFGFSPPKTGAGWSNVEIIDFTPSATAATVAYLYSLDGGTGEIGTVWSTVLIPEPMTIALLGLGGLFLRRRK